MIAIVLLTLAFTPIAAEMSWHICGKTATNYTANSAYHANLELLSTALSNNASTNRYLFAMGSVGAAPDTVYGLALCRGDVNATVCRACVVAAFRAAQQRCAYREDVTIFCPSCRLRFSGKDFLRPDDYADGVVNTMNMTDTTNTEPLLPGWDPGDATSVTSISGIIKKLLQDTARQAAYNSGHQLFATGRMDVGGNFPELFSMAQCVPALTHRDCSWCLEVINFRAMENFAGKQGGRLLALWCNLRYDTSPFYNGDPMVTILPPAKSVVPAAPSSCPTCKRHIRKVLIIALVVSLLALFLCFIKVSFIFMRRQGQGNGRREEAKMNVKDDESLPWGVDRASSEFMIYDFSQVLEATANFSEKNKLGQGGYGPVYMGQLPDGLEIAVKRLASHSGQDETRRASLDWNRRVTIIEGISQGLVYLHKHSRLRIIHRDLKASNILLDKEMNPKISDFGLAKIFSTHDTERSTNRIIGTYGYMAPEYALQGIFSIKSDVFSFGVLMLEIVSGKKSSCFHGYGDFINLLGHAWQLWKDRLWLHLTDPSLDTEYHSVDIMRCINIALLCVQENAADRPTMSEVVAMLSSKSMTLPEPKHPPYFQIRIKDEEDSADVGPSSVKLTVSALDGR